MTIYYRDEAGIVAEDIHDQEIDFCDGFMYYLGDELDEGGNRVDKKIALSALVRMVIW